MDFESLIKYKLLTMLNLSNWTLLGLAFTNLNLILNDFSLFLIKLSTYNKLKNPLKIEQYLFNFQYDL